jgi:hypothetical protein
MWQVQIFGIDNNNYNYFQEEIICKLNVGNACHHAVQNLLSSLQLSKSVKIKSYQLFYVGMKTNLICKRKAHIEGV